MSRKSLDFVTAFTDNTFSAMFSNLTHQSLNGISTEEETGLKQSRNTTQSPANIRALKFRISRSARSITILIRKLELYFDGLLALDC